MNNDDLDLILNPPVILGLPWTHMKDLASVMSYGCKVLGQLLDPPEEVRKRYRDEFIAKGHTEEEYKKMQSAAELVIMESWYKSQGCDTSKIFTPEVREILGMDKVLKEAKK